MFPLHVVRQLAKSLESLRLVAAFIWAKEFASTDPETSALS
jgi:hypothetical protein